MCQDHGLFKTADGFVWVSPSDCHEEDGHYQTHYDESGKFLWTDVPWQIFPSKEDLTEEEMAS